MTSSPLRKAVTPSPTSATVPATSKPGTCGKDTGKAELR
jgi:hypothetical protein